MSAVKLALLLTMYTQFAGAQPAELPQVQAPPVAQVVTASWYGNGVWHGDTTANGEDFDPQEFTCAHRTLPFDTVVLLVNRSNGRRVWCRVNDRGPYIARLPDGSQALKLSRGDPGVWSRDIDLSIATARALGTIDSGLGRLEMRYWPETAGSGGLPLSAKLYAFKL